MADSFDLLVLGGGAAGLAAARAARWEGKTAALVSDSPLGGDCTFTGCVPSKTLIEASRQGDDFASALERVQSVIATIAATENADVLREEGVDVVEASGTFVGPKTIEADGRVLQGHAVVIATGSRPTVPPIKGLADTPFLTNEAFFEPRPQPASLVVIGAGAIGCELGEAMARFGTKVTIVEFAPRILTVYEPDAAALVAANMETLGIDLRVNTGAQAVSYNNGQFTIDLGDSTVVADELLVATGRTPNTTGFGLETTGVGTDKRGFIEVDEYLKTAVDGVYAAGDCNGVQLLSHAADEMGRVAAWTALRSGRKYAYDPKRIPHAVFTTPEIAAIGIHEADAPRNARVAEMPMTLNDRALAANHAEGFVRMIARRSRLTGHKAGGKIVGATIVGGRAGEMINEVALTMRGSGYPVRLAQTVRAYPSWSSIMQKTAALWYFDYDGHSTRSPRRK